MAGMQGMRGMPRHTPAHESPLAWIAQGVRARAACDAVARLLPLAHDDDVWLPRVSPHQHYPTPLPYYYSLALPPLIIATPPAHAHTLATQDQRKGGAAFKQGGPKQTKRQAAAPERYSPQPQQQQAQQQQAQHRVPLVRAPAPPHQPLPQAPQSQQAQQQPLAAPPPPSPQQGGGKHLAGLQAAGAGPSGQHQRQGRGVQGGRGGGSWQQQGRRLKGQEGPGHCKV
jgi:hypothetical protein